MAEELTQEDVFDNDIDPMDGIRALRREEGVAEEDLPERDTDSSTILDEQAEAAPGDDELAELQDEPEEIPEEEEEEAPEPKATAEDEDPDAVDNAPADGEEEPAGEEASGDAEESPEPAKTESLKFKANGQEFEFTEAEMKDQFATVFGQAVDYTQKMQKIAPYRKMISALEQEGVTTDQLNMALDAIKGDKGAIKHILDTHKIDSYDLTGDEDAPEYQPTNYGKEDFQLQIEEVTSRIDSDPEYQITTDVIGNQWDEGSRAIIADNPTMISGLHNDIKSGLFDKISPMAMKLKVLDGNAVKKSDIEYYMIAGEQNRLANEGSTKTVEELNKPAQSADSEFEEASSEAKKKRAASSTRTRADRKGVIDYLDDDDEAYDAWYKKTMNV